MVTSMNASIHRGVDLITNLFKEFRNWDAHALWASLFTNLKQNVPFTLSTLVQKKSYGEPEHAIVLHEPRGK